MDNTGRITRTLTPTAGRIVFGRDADAGVETEMAHASLVDFAHLVMLAERGVVKSEKACALLRAIGDLRAEGFAPLRGRAAPRGLYLLYENYLIEQLGPDVGGVLQTARSRNDLNATVVRLRLRAPFLRLVGEALRLEAVLLRRARRYADVLMPAYTHYQASVPVTYGHYLAGVAQAVARDAAACMEAGDDIERCPLGAGAVGGTTLPVDNARTAALLGFERPALNSLDAVASRDLVLRLLGAAAVLGVTLSRAASDLLLWSTAEFGFLKLPDELVGSSSMMPQKRNPFLLEHVQGRSGAALGAFVAAAYAAHNAPYSNSVAVSTESVAPLWLALQKTTESVTLLRLVVAGARPEPAAMAERARVGYTSATELANRLAVEGGEPFRSAHRAVGEIIREAVARGGAGLEAAAGRLVEEGRVSSLEGLDPRSVARASEYGGGPGPASLERCLRASREEWSRAALRRRELARKWRAAEVELTETVARLCG
ncbi:MAG: argininosuccinate lyase [Acidobacteria bacterium]|nr:argininosuccinate lyase [Acidobacteriota bacterium]